MKFGRAIPTLIKIMPTDSHDFIVDVGFATFACEGPESTLRVLGDYLKHPDKFIDELKATRDKGKELARVGADSKLRPRPVIMTPCDDMPKERNLDF